MPPQLSILLLLFAMFSYGEAVSSCYDVTNSTEKCDHPRDKSCRIEVNYDEKTTEMNVKVACCSNSVTKEWNADGLDTVQLFCSTDNCNRLDEKNVQEALKAICKSHPEYCPTTPTPIKPKRQLRFSEEYGLYFIIGLGIYCISHVGWIGYLVRWLIQFEAATQRLLNRANARNTGARNRNTATNPSSAQNQNKKTNLPKSKSLPILIPRRFEPTDPVEKERCRLINAGILVRPQNDDETVKETKSDWGSHLATVEPPPRRRRRHHSTTEE